MRSLRPLGHKALEHLHGVIERLVQSFAKKTIAVADFKPDPLKPLAKGTATAKPLAGAYDSTEFDEKYLETDYYDPNNGKPSPRWRGVDYAATSGVEAAVDAKRKEYFGALVQEVALALVAIGAIVDLHPKGDSRALLKLADGAGRKFANEFKPGTYKAAALQGLLLNPADQAARIQLLREALDETKGVLRGMVDVSTATMPTLENLQKLTDAAKLEEIMAAVNMLHDGGPSVESTYTYSLTGNAVYEQLIGKTHGANSELFRLPATMASSPADSLHDLLRYGAKPKKSDRALGLADALLSDAVKAAIQPIQGSVDRKAYHGVVTKDVDFIKTFMALDASAASGGPVAHASFVDSLMGSATVATSSSSAAPMDVDDGAGVGAGGSASGGGVATSFDAFLAQDATTSASAAAPKRKKKVPAPTSSADA